MLITQIIARKNEFKAEFDDMEYVELTWDEMRKRRLRTQTDRGRSIEFAFPEGDSLADGDLIAVDGSMGIIIKAAVEVVLSIVPSSPLELGIICYELGNRHLPAWISPEEILVSYDSVLEANLTERGIDVHQKNEALDRLRFVPVGGGITHHHHHGDEADEQ
jgi:urease accessory protein